MKISILITSYNKGKYLKECIESCLIQDDENFEIILFDNFSTDETNIVLSSFKNKIKIHKKNKISNFPALNQIDLIKNALDISSGEIICLLDADDYFKKNKISKVRNFFKENNTTSILFDLPTLKKGNQFQKFYLKNKIINDMWQTTIPTSSISIRRNFFKDCIKNDFLKGFNLLEIDFRINVYAQNFKKNFSILEESLNIYRQVENSIMTQNKKFSINWWKKRLQAHEFMKNVYNKQNKKYKNLDFSLTKNLVTILNLLKI